MTITGEAMEDGNWQHYAHWHQLFDELCNGAGYYDTATLASAYCALTASRGERQFDTAVRNLNNWRSGRHLPRTKNLRLLARLLKVTENPDLQRHWNALYKQANEIEATETAGGLPSVVAPRAIDTDHDTARAQAWVHFLSWQPYPSGPARKRFSAFEMAAGGAAMLIVGAVAGSLVTASGWRPWAGPADNAPIVPFKPKVTMKVGETRPIYAERGDCGKLPREWLLVEADLPAVRTGTFSDGGLARRYSKFCQGLTPARAIVFNATQSGVEEFEIQGDFFQMTVTE
ncbi:MAG: hypothetical protein ACTHOP_06010 [Mesorhizobium sp.]